MIEVIIVERDVSNVKFYSPNLATYVDLKQLDNDDRISATNQLRDTLLNTTHLAIFENDTLETMIAKMKLNELDIPDTNYHFRAYFDRINFKYAACPSKPSRLTMQRSFNNLGQQSVNLANNVKYLTCDFNLKEITLVYQNASGLDTTRSFKVVNPTTPLYDDRGIIEICFTELGTVSPTDSYTDINTVLQSLKFMKKMEYDVNIVWEPVNSAKSNWVSNNKFYEDVQSLEDLFEKYDNDEGQSQQTLSTTDKSAETEFGIPWFETLGTTFNSDTLDISRNAVFCKYEFYDEEFGQLNMHNCDSLVFIGCSFSIQQFNIKNVKNAIFIGCDIITNDLNITGSTCLFSKCQIGVMSAENEKEIINVVDRHNDNVTVFDNCEFVCTDSSEPITFINVEGSAIIKIFDSEFEALLNDIYAYNYILNINKNCVLENNIFTKRACRLIKDESIQISNTNTVLEVSM